MPTEPSLTSNQYQNLLDEEEAGTLTPKEQLVLNTVRNLLLKVRKYRAAAHFMARKYVKDINGQPGSVAILRRFAKRTLKEFTQKYDNSMSVDDARDKKELDAAVTEDAQAK